MVKHIKRLRTIGVEIPSDLIERLSKIHTISGGGIYPPFGKRPETKNGLSIKVKKNYGKGNGWK